MFNLIRSGVALVLALSLSGCVLNQDPVASADLNLNNDWHAQGPLFEANHITRDKWWQRFDEVVLNELIDQALESNADIQVALANVEQARAYYGLERWSYMPQGALQLSRERGSFSDFELEGARPYTAYRSVLSLGWEIDLFGRIRNANKIALAELNGSAAYADAVRLLVTSEVASTYYLARAAFDRRQIRAQALQDQREISELTRVLVEEQRASQDELDRALAELEDNEVELLLEEEHARGLELRMAALLGLQPGQWQLPDFAETDKPLNLQAIAIGDITTMLQARPDIRRAQQALIAQQSAVGIARANYFPTLNLAGFFGFVSGNSGELGKSGSGSWLAGPSLVWNALDIGRTRQQVSAAHAGVDMALAHYESTVLKAIAETESALLRYATVNVEMVHRDSQRRHARSTVAAARARNEEGMGNYLDVLIASRDSLRADIAHVNSLGSHRLATVQVFKALGSTTL